MFPHWVGSRFLVSWISLEWILPVILTMCDLLWKWLSLEHSSQDAWEAYQPVTDLRGFHEPLAREVICEITVIADVLYYS